MTRYVSSDFETEEIQGWFEDSQFPSPILLLTTGSSSRSYTKKCKKCKKCKRWKRWKKWKKCFKIKCEPVFRGKSTDWLTWRLTISQSNNVGRVSSQLCWDTLLSHDTVGSGAFHRRGWRWVAGRGESWGPKIHRGFLQWGYPKWMIHKGKSY